MESVVEDIQEVIKPGWMAEQPRKFLDFK